MSKESENAAVRRALDGGLMRALNERTRLKIALTEILTEWGHAKPEIDEAIQGVCDCDFSQLRTLLGLPAQKVK